jgi:hypothetical protein
MNHNDGCLLTVQTRTPWNKGKLTGAKPPLRPKHVWAIRTRLMIQGRPRRSAAGAGRGSSSPSLPRSVEIWRRWQRRLDHHDSCRVSWQRQPGRSWTRRQPESAGRQRHRGGHAEHGYRTEAAGTDTPAVAEGNHYRPARQPDQRGRRASIEKAAGGDPHSRATRRGARVIGQLADLAGIA